MKDGEMELFAQLLLESRTCAYIEWLDNEIIMNANNNINNKRKTQQTIIVTIFLGVEKLFTLVG